MGRTQEQAAASASLRSRRSVAKYERLVRLPSEMKKPRQRETRRDALEADSPTTEQMLEDAPRLQSKALFEWSCDEHPGRY